MSTFTYPTVVVTIPDNATETTQLLVLAELDLDIVDQIDTTPLLDVSSTNIPASASLPVQIVASLAADVKKIIVVDDIGEYIGLYTGASSSEVLECILHLGGGETKVEIAAGTRISLRHMKNTALTADFIAINFLG